MPGKMRLNACMELAHARASVTLLAIDCLLRKGMRCRPDEDAHPERWFSCPEIKITA